MLLRGGTALLLWDIVAAVAGVTPARARPVVKVRRGNGRSLQLRCVSTSTKHTLGARLL